MTDPTVVSLCHEYTTWLTFKDMAALRRCFNGLGRRDVTVPAILKQYNGGEP